MIPGAIPTETIMVKGRIDIRMWNPNVSSSDTIVYTVENAFQSSGFNYLRNVLVSAATAIDPIKYMIMHHSGGTSTIETDNTSLPSIGDSRYNAGWSTVNPYSVTQFSLRSSLDTEYSRIYMSFTKPAGYTLNVEWTIMLI